MRRIVIAAALALAACGGSPSQQDDSPTWTLKPVAWDGASACRPLHQVQPGSYDQGVTQLVPFACPNGAPTASSGCVPGTGLPPPNDGPLCENEDLSSIAPGLTQSCWFTCPGR